MFRRKKIVRKQYWTENMSNVELLNQLQIRCKNLDDRKYESKPQREFLEKARELNDLASDSDQWNKRCNELILECDNDEGSLLLTKFDIRSKLSNDLVNLEKIMEKEYGITTFEEMKEREKNGAKVIPIKYAMDCLIQLDLVKNDLNEKEKNGPYSEQEAKLVYEALIALQKTLKDFKADISSKKFGPRERLKARALDKLMNARLNTMIKVVDPHNRKVEKQSFVSSIKAKFGRGR